MSSIKESQYNCPQVSRVNYTKALFNDLNKAYRKIRCLPRFIHDLLQLKPDCPDYVYLTKNPKLIEWTEDGSFVILPNKPKIFDNSRLIEDPLTYKDSEDGLAINAWFIHPKLLETSVFNDKKARCHIKKLRLLPNSFNMTANYNGRQRDQKLPTIAELEDKSSIPYLATIMDLTASDIERLKELKKTVETHLRTVYGVTIEDNVELFFHDFPKEHYATLHLHIRVNRDLHPREKEKSISLNEIITSLEEGISIRELLLCRGYKFTSDYRGHKGDIIKETLNTHSIGIEDNPYRL